ncbi:MAG: zinc metallopeptidase [Candidatus Marinimicrobia bacterium]|nr:zinc metallopeptidase [Candidatus Neomarinimicrobiota bacterium]
MFFDPLYLLFALPGLLLGLLASAVTRSTFARYAKVRASSGLTGAEAAARMLAGAGVRGVTIEPTQGFLSDHYDPRSHTLRLSPDVYSSNSLSAMGVACHEAGHALQHAEEYAPLTLRSALVPATQFGSKFSYILFVLGFIFRLQPLIYLGILLFTVAVVFTLVTLPVEWDASARAKRAMVAAGVVSPAEQSQAGAVLNAAFLTYVASAVSAILTLLYYLMRAGVLGGRRS